MKRVGVGVGDGFRIRSEGCIRYLKENEEVGREVKRELIDDLGGFCKGRGKGFWCDDKLLLV
ncbi:hypothetical protein [Staphylococcus epidermidis]|uniref:hypothetical protein n=1 Tax=Staphylococcus epidermidis TaxID=1282 RepID=UPI0011AA3AF5